MKRVLVAAAVFGATLLIGPVETQAGDILDASIRGGLTDNYKGDDVLTPPDPISDQTARARTRIGRSANFQILVENQSPSPDTIDVDGCGSNPKFKVTYKEAGVNYTSEVIEGSHTQNIGANDFNDDLQMKIKVKDTAEVGDIKKCKVVVDNSNEDAVRARLKVKAG